MNLLRLGIETFVSKTAWLGADIYFRVERSEELSLARERNKNVCGSRILLIGSTGIDSPLHFNFQNSTGFYMSPVLEKWIS